MFWSLWYLYWMIYSSPLALVDEFDACESRLHHLSESQNFEMMDRRWLNLVNIPKRSIKKEAFGKWDFICLQLWWRHSPEFSGWSVKLRFDGVDSPAAWAVRKYGCNLSMVFASWLLSSLHWYLKHPSKTISCLMGSMMEFPNCPDLLRQGVGQWWGRISADSWANAFDCTYDLSMFMFACSVCVRMLDWTKDFGNNLNSWCAVVWWCCCFMSYGSHASLSYSFLKFVQQLPYKFREKVLENGSLLTNSHLVSPTYVSNTISNGLIPLPIVLQILYYPASVFKWNHHFPIFTKRMNKTCILIFFFLMRRLEHKVLLRTWLAPWFLLQMPFAPWYRSNATRCVSCWVEV